MELVIICCLKPCLLLLIISTVLDCHRSGTTTSMAVPVTCYTPTALCPAFTGQYSTDGTDADVNSALPSYISETRTPKKDADPVLSRFFPD